MAIKKQESIKAEIILLDIETSPITAYTWETYQTNALKVLEPSKIISCSWKRLGEKELYVKSISDYKGYKAGIVDDRNLIQDIWKVLDRADIVIAHNGLSFDIRKLNARFVINGLPSPSSYEVIDTLKVAKKYFKFDSNNLNSLGSYLDCGSKLNNGGFDLWVRCIAGDKDAWTKMKEYNKQDVILLEKIYLKLRPYMDSHPNVRLITGKNVYEAACNTCGSDRVSKRGFRYTATGRKQRFQCGECGSWSVGPFERVSKAKENDGQ